MNKKQVALIVFLSWNVIGFIISLYIQWNQQCKRVEGYSVLQCEQVHENCIYRSIAGFTNLGYVVACELYRSRFEIGK